MYPETNQVTKWELSTLIKRTLKHQDLRREMYYSVYIQKLKEGRRLENIEAKKTENTEDKKTENIEDKTIVKKQKK